MVSTTKRKIFDSQLCVTLIIRFKTSVSCLKVADAISDVIGTILETRSFPSKDSMTNLSVTNVPLSIITTSF